jgi:hypothetical protein
MLCLDVLLRRQWIEHERLSYPIVQLPLAMTQPEGRFFKSKMMWIGLAIAALINLLNGLHALYPAVPGIPLRQANIGGYFTEKPWNAMGSTPIYVLPFAVGLGYLMPLELSFSIWFFYLFWKMERVVFYLVLLSVLEDGASCGKYAGAFQFAGLSPLWAAGTRSISGTCILRFDRRTALFLGHRAECPKTTAR